MTCLPLFSFDWILVNQFSVLIMQSMSFKPEQAKEVSAARAESFWNTLWPRLVAHGWIILTSGRSSYFVPPVRNLWCEILNCSLKILTYFVIALYFQTFRSLYFDFRELMLTTVGLVWGYTISNPPCRLIYLKCLERCLYLVTGHTFFSVFTKTCFNCKSYWNEGR